MWLQIQYPRIYRRKILSVLWYRNEFHEMMSYSVALLFNHISFPERWWWHSNIQQGPRRAPPAKKKKGDTEMFGGV